MDEALDSFLQFDESTVGEYIDHLAADPGTDGKALLDIIPWTRLCLLQSQRDPLTLLVDLEHLDIDLLFHGEDLVGVVDTTPRHVRDVEQAIDTAEINECAKVRDVLHDSLTHLTQFDLAHQIGLHLIATLFE